MEHSTDSQLLWVLVALFAATFICASLMRAKGVRGLLALVGLAGVIFYLVSDFEGWQLSAAVVSALVGLSLGGKLSDYLELSRVERKNAAERAKRQREMGIG